MPVSLQAATPPVSYSRQVAPILALHCNGCHGDAGGFRTRTYPDLMKGGNLGQSVVPGDANASLLVHFLDGRRGEEHRMPLGGRPLGAAEIAWIRRWIAEGAREDADTTDKYKLRLPGLRSQPLRIRCRLPSQAYLVLTVAAQGTPGVLYSEVGSVKSPKERGDAGSPGEWIWWDLRPGRGWPRRITVELTVAYAERPPAGAELLATPIGRPDQVLARAVFPRP